MSKSTPAKTNVQTVQVPGEGPTDQASTPTNQPEAGQAKQEAKPAPMRSARDYRSMSASEVNPKELKAPVLTKDGWVCPAP